MPQNQRSRRVCPVILLLAIVFAWALAEPAAAQEGAIRGVITDKDFQVPLSGVRVTLVELRLTTFAVQGGVFNFANIPPGTYTLAFAKDGYEREVVSSVLVTPGHLTEVNVEMRSEVVELEELVVSGTDILADSDVGLLEIRATAVSVQDAISSDLISRAGAGDVAGALKLVVGASIAEGKYATVRGLSDRYTGTTLNGVRLPSADPRRRAVQMDLFPTGTIESVTVTKTFTPDLQGDFTGGGVDIKTRSIPDGFTLNVSESIGYNTNASYNEDRLSYVGGGVSSFGIDDGGRDMPSEADDKLPPYPRFSANPPPAQIEASKAYDELVGTFSPVMGVESQEAGSNYGASLLVGDRFEFGEDRVLGVLAAMTYSRKFDWYENGENNNAVVAVVGQPIALTKQREDNRGTDELLFGGLASVVFQPKAGQELSLRYLRNQGTEDEARFQTQETGFRAEEQNQSLHYTERSVSSIQLHGDHKIGRLHLDWTGSSNKTEQDEPDVRFFRNSFNDETLSGEMPANSTDAQNTRRIFRFIEEDNEQLAFNVSLPFTPHEGMPIDFKAGALLDQSDRDYDQNSFTYTFATQFGSIFNPKVQENRAYGRFQADHPDELWTDVFLNPSHLGLAANQPPAPNQLLWAIVPLGDDVDYTAEQDIDAGYVMGDFSFGHGFRLIAGARYESTDLSIIPTNDAFGRVQIIEVVNNVGDRAIVGVPEDEATADISDGHLLPSIGLVYEIKPGMNLRGTFSRTLARPTFRELAPVATEEFIFGDEFIGNTELTLSTITNYDVRWEWFRGEDQVFAASVFYKDITDPIEVISFSTGGRNFIQPVNFETGQVFGVEVEARAPLDPLGSAFTGFAVGANATWIESEVDVPEFEQVSLSDFGLDEDTRRLQGQPEFLVNLNVTWDHEASGTSAGLFYNVVGETLLTGAARGLEDGNPNVFERPRATLDFKVSRKFNDRYGISIRGENVLRQSRKAVYRTPDDNEAVKSYRETAALYTISGTVSW